MKKILMLMFLGIFLMGFVFAANREQAQDSTGPYHDEIITAGGMNGTPNQIQTNSEIRNRIKAGNYDVEGKQIRIEEQVNNKIRLKSQDISADTDLELEEDTSNSQTKLKTTLSNGRNAEIKIMPDTASETALQRLKLKACSEENNCSIELKEVGQGEEVRVAYEVRAEKQAKVFGLFRTQMRVESQVDAETGEVIQTKRPWWSFLATEEDEVVESSE
ncbi:MAG: hypothetical protein ABFQ65_00195 [Nanoarchaeota archaeon]